MTVRLCNAGYFRPSVIDQPMPCQYLAQHEGPHSWEALRRADAAEAEAAAATAVREIVVTPGALLRAIEDGTFDPYIESILAVGHERKRVLRGKRTFLGLVSGE